MPHLLDPLSPSRPLPVPIGTTPVVDALVADAPVAASGRRFPLGLVVVSVSPFVGRDDALAVVAASVVAGNRTIVVFPAGTAVGVRSSIAGLSRVVGAERVRLSTADALARDADVDLAHLLWVTDAATTLEGVRSLDRQAGAHDDRRVALAKLLTTDFSVVEWNDRVGEPGPPSGAHCGQAGSPASPSSSAG